MFRATITPAPERGAAIVQFGEIKIFLTIVPVKSPSVDCVYPLSRIAIGSADEF